MIYIKNPSVTLYAFHLRTDFEKEVVADAAHLWEKLTQLSNVIPELQQLPEKLICYQNGKYNPIAEQGQQTDYLELIQPERVLNFSSKNQDILTGSVYPLRLHDTYAVDLTLSYQNQEIAINNLHRLNPQNCLMPNNIQASLGQTLLLYGEPVGDNITNQDLANKYVKTVLQEIPSFKQQGQLFGSPIFVYETISTKNAPHSNELTHILVWLGKHEQTVKLAEKSTPWLINLLNCHHKILFTYHQANQSNELARKIYQKLDAKNKQLNQLPTIQEQRLKLLENILNETSDNTFKYANHLRNLTDHHTTIEINITNYIKWLGHIRDLSLATDNLQFLKDFHTNNCQHYQQQTKVYLDYLKPGHNLFEQFITTILGLVNIGEQKQQLIRAEKFEFLITFIGAAVGTGAISATVIPDPLSLFEIPQWLNNLPLLKEILKVMFHLIIGGAIAMILTPLISVIARWFTRKE
ncbi:MAG: hypothetical protein QM487_01295 [Candidatus Marithrix sp.]